MLFSEVGFPGRHALCVGAMTLAIGTLGCGDDETSATGVGGNGGEAAGAGGAETGGGGTGGIGGIGGTGGTGPCDVFAQDCPNASTDKCTVTFDPAVMQVPASCVASLGNVAIGESCARPTNEAGIDDCANDGYCAFWGADAGTRVCHAWCDDAHPCQEAGHDCFPMGLSGGPIGVCTLQCTVAGSECDGLTGSSCKYYANPGIDGMLMCTPDGAATEGMACVEPEECAAGTSCIDDVCRTLCTVGDGSCGTTCTALAGVQNQGYCAP